MHGLSLKCLILAKMHIKSETGTHTCIWKHNTRSMLQWMFGWITVTRKYCTKATLLKKKKKNPKNRFYNWLWTFLHNSPSEFIFLITCIILSGWVSDSNSTWAFWLWFFFNFKQGLSTVFFCRAQIKQSNWFKLPIERGLKPSVPCFSDKQVLQRKTPHFLYPVFLLDI